MESFQCNYELNPVYREQLVKNGLVISGETADGGARIVELPENRFYIGTGFLPQLNSTPDRPHPLFVSFIKAASKTKKAERQT